jgi:hypothetical protein
VRFCEDHWERLRVAIEDRGLAHLIAPDGAVAAEQMADQLKRAAAGEEPGTAVNYDPLMAAHWAIANNVMTQLGSNSLYLMGGGPEDPVTGHGPKYDGRTWPRCPLCYINLAHEVSCTDPACTLDKEHGYDWMIARAADDQAEHVAQLGEKGSS